MSINDYVFGNIGRDKGPKSTNRIDLDCLRALRDRVSDEKACVQLAEIREGDDNNELKLTLQVFKGWRLYGASTREPILLSPDQPKARSKVIWIQNSSVRLWSPRRSILIVDLADESESIFAAHPAAGANGQGERPKWARPLLQTSWDLTMKRLALEKKRRHQMGRHCTTQIDANAYSTKVYPLMPGEKVVWQDDTDWGRVWPAAGCRAVFQDKGRIDFHLDSHDGHHMSGLYKRD